MNDKKVYAAINAVMLELVKTGIGKGQTNAFDKYKFRGIDDVYNALGPALAKSGLVILPRVISREAAEKPTKNGGVQVAVTLCVEYDFVAVDDGSMHTVVAYGEALDRGDKATQKAMAAAFKYAAFQAFCIPVDGSPDADSQSPELVDLVSPGSIAAINKLIVSTETDISKFYAAFGIDSVQDLTEVQAVTAIKMLEKKGAK